MALRGHEWIGGAAGFDNRHHAPQNSSLLLVGIISGSKNFDVRSWLRRAFWQQRPWRLGVEWRFVVGTRLPRGDNDRVSLHYEAARHGDLDLIQGSEVPPRQARVAMRWWLKAAAYVDQAQADGSGGPRYIGLTYDSLIVSLPLLALRLRSIQPAIGRGGGRRTRQLVYGGPTMGAVDRRRDGTLAMALRAHHPPPEPSRPGCPATRHRRRMAMARRWSDAQAGGARALLVLLSDGRVTNLPPCRCGARAVSSELHPRRRAHAPTSISSK